MVPVSGSKERRKAVEKSVVRAALVTKSVTRTVMGLWAIGGGGGGGQEAGGVLTASKTGTKEPRLNALFQVLKIVVNAENEWGRRDSRIRGRVGSGGDRGWRGRRAPEGGTASACAVRRKRVGAGAGA